MGFEALLGNERLKDNLTASLRRGRISHFYLISGPEGSGKHTLARLLSAAILCRNEGKPCGRCGPCRKVTEGSHPDVITVEDPEHKNVAVKIVRQAREDMFILPNESDRKIYIFPQELGIEGQNALLKILEEPPSYGVFILLTDNPQKLHTEGQNALLKILEEPPAYGVFILLSDNPEKLLPTVRSRCTELPLQPVPERTMKAELARRFPKAEPEDLTAAVSRSGGWLGQAIALLQSGDTLPPQALELVTALADRDALALTRVLTPMEKWKRDQLIPVLGQWLQMAEQALCCRSGIDAPSAAVRNLSSARTSQELMGIIECLKKALEYAQSNVSPGAVCGWLSWELRQ